MKRLKRLTVDNILVVNSDQSEAARLSGLIRSMSSDYMVQCACSGYEAFKKTTKNGKTHVVLAAETLSDMTAQTFFDIIMSVQKQTTCILLADEHGVSTGKRAQTDGSFRIIKKPYNDSELAYALEQAFDYGGLNAKLIFNTKLTRFFLTLIPLAVVLGIVAGLLSK